MSQPLQLLNFCKSGIKKVDKAFAPASPLDTVELLGLNSFGCQPLLSHRSDPGQDILSQVKQTNGAVVRHLLTTQDDDGIIGGGPPAEECLPYGANIAGLRGALPISGSAANPFPTTIATADLLWTAHGAKFTQTINGTSQDLSGDSSALDLSSTRGFGKLGQGESGAGTLIKLPPDNREYSGLVRLRANHNYVSTLTLPYSPQLDPLMFVFDATYGYYIDPSGFPTTGTVIGTSGSCEAEAFIASTMPCLTTTNGDLIDPVSTLEQNGPSLHRQYNLYRLNSFTMPACGQAYSATWDVPSSSLRTFLWVYVASSRIDSLVCHEGSTVSTTVLTLPTPGNGPPSIITPIFSGIPFDTIYQFAVTGTEPSYTFDVSHGATTITGTLTFSPAPTHVHFFECYLDMHQVGNPSLACS